MSNRTKTILASLFAGGLYGACFGAILSFLTGGFGVVFGNANPRSDLWVLIGCTAAGALFAYALLSDQPGGTESDDSTSQEPPRQEDK